MSCVKVIIIGANYAGLMCALRLQGKTRYKNVHVTLINAGEVFVANPKLIQLAGAGAGAASDYPIAKFVGDSDIEFINSRVIELRPNANNLKITGGIILDYDYLVIATASEVDKDQIPGIREHAFVLDDHRDNGSKALYRKLSQDEEPKELVIVDSGVRGIELSGEIVDSFKNARVILVSCHGFGEFTTRQVANYMRQSLLRRGVNLVEHFATQMIDEDRLIASDGREIGFDICAWSGGYKANQLAIMAGFATNRKGQVLVDEFLRAKGRDNVFIVGDSMPGQHVSGAPRADSLLGAAVSGAYVADTLTRRLQKKCATKFAFSNYGHLIALGEKDAVGFASYPNGRTCGFLLKGRPALWVRNFFIKLFIRLLFVERYIPGFFNYSGKSRGNTKGRRICYSRAALDKKLR